MKKALVVGRNYCNILAVARQLGEAGFSAKVLKIHKTRPKKLNFLRTMSPDKMSKYVEIYREVVATEEDVIEAMLEMAEDEKILLLPVDDYSVYQVDENLDKLQAKFITCSIKGKQGAINELMDKKKQKECCNMPTLKSWLLETGDEIPGDITYPVFIKPNVSMKATKARMKKCSSREELETTLAGFGEYSMLCEEFCDIKNEYSLLGFSTCKEAVAPAVFMATRGGHKERKGVAVTGMAVSADRFELFCKESEKMVLEMGYTGIFDIDLIEDQEGNIYFVEINFRPGASIYAFDNLTGEFARCMLEGGEVRKMKFEPGLSFVSEKVLMEEYVRGDCSKKEFRELIDGADICFVKSEEDPAPFEEFKKYYFLADLLRLAYKVKK